MSAADFKLLCIAGAAMATITTAVLLASWAWSEIKWRRWGRR